MFSAKSIYHLGNDELIRSASELLAKLIIDWGQLFAVTAPWGIELNEDSLCLITSDLLEVLSDEHLDWLGIPIGWDVLREQMWLELVVEEALHERLDDRGEDLGALRLVLDHVGTQRDESDLWRVLLLHAEELQNTLVLVDLGVDEHEDRFALEALGSSLELVQLGLEVRALHNQKQGLDYLI